MPGKSVPKRNKSALKRARQAEKRRLRNRTLKTYLKNLSKKVEIEVSNKNLEAAKAALTKAIPAINRAASKGVIHKNTASRNASRLTRLVNGLGSSVAA